VVKLEGAANVLKASYGVVFMQAHDIARETTGDTVPEEWQWATRDGPLAAQPAQDARRRDRHERRVRPADLPNNEGLHEACMRRKKSSSED